MNEIELSQSVCPEYQHCFHEECNADNVCRNADYWSRYWKIQGGRIVFTIPHKKAAHRGDGPVRCCYCDIDIKNSTDYTVEHLVPRSLGGNNKAVNKFHCCKACNHEKGSTSMLVYVAALEKKLAELSPSDDKGALIIKLTNAKKLQEYIREKGRELYSSDEKYQKSLKEKITDHAIDHFRYYRKRIENQQP